MAVELIADYCQRAVPVSDAGQAAEARRTVTRLAGKIGFDETDSGTAAIIITELATNLVKHAGGGEILLRTVARGAVLGLELIALDRGPGITNLSQSFRDGYSTAGSPGTGLGAMARLASEFDIHSTPGKGTAVLARVWPRGARMEMPRGLEVGAVSLPKPGEQACGDGWKSELLADRSLCLVVDGLGHGAHAAAAARSALEIFTLHRNKNPAEIVERAHDALRSTRGAALAVAQMNYTSGNLQFSGVGNIAAAILTGDTSRQLVSLNGTAGVEARKIAEFSYPWSGESLLIMHSDGLMSRWGLNLYPGLTQRHPSLIAAVLYRDFNRGRDDITVLAAKTVDNFSGGTKSWLTQ